MTHIVSMTEKRYTYQEIQAAFPVPPIRSEALPERRAPVAAGNKRSTPAERRRKYALTTLHRLADELSSTPEGGRNNKLNTVSFQAGRLIAGKHLERNEVVDALTNAAQRAGLTDHEITQTLNRGLTDGETDADLLEHVGNATGHRSQRKRSGEGGSERVEESDSKRPPQEHGYLNTSKQMRRNSGMTRAATRI